MIHRPCLSLSLFLFLAIASGVPLAGSATGVHRDDESPARLSMEPVQVPLSGGGSVTAERGKLRVPIVRADPQSKEIAVDVWRFHRVEGADPGTPPVFRLYGGPGWPGMEPEDVNYEQDLLPMLEVSDLVIVGQRGIGTSTPDTDCSPFALDADGEPSREEQAELLQRGCRDCREHWESQGYDLTGFNVIEAASDVNDVRRLLGYEQITLWGGSFGSHWGMTILRYHPEAVARAVLTGMEGPDHTYDMPTGILNALERIAFEAELSSELLDHIPEDGLIEALRAVIEDVEAEPIELEVAHPATGAETTVRLEANDLRDMALGYTQRASSRSGAAFWPADVIALHQGDFVGAARSKLQRGGGSSGLPTASFFMLDCGSGISPARLEELRNDPAAEVVGELGWFYETACAAWDADLGDDFRADFVTDIPTVVVHGTWDMSTPFENALELVPCFEQLSFVVVEGGSHGALGEAMRHSQEFRAALMEFLATGETSGLPGEIHLPPVIWKRP